MPLCRAVTALLIASAVASPLAAQDSARVPPMFPIEMHGFVEVFYRSGDPLTKDGFRLRKADFKFMGEVSPHIKWRIGFDGSKVLGVNKTIGTGTDSLLVTDLSIDQKSRVLQDAALTYTVSPALNVDVGQQILPMGLEGTTSLAQIETIERSNISADKSRGVPLGEVRDIGVAVNGRASQLEYHVGVFNETGDDAGTTDSNDQKAVVGRLVVHPSLVPNIEFGGTGAFEGGPPTQHRERGGGEFQYRDDRFTLRTEAMSARDGLLHRLGWYGLGAYRPTTRLQLAARFDSWDRDRTHESSANDALEHQIVVGGSYLIDGPSAKFAVNVIRQTFPQISSVRSSTFLLAAFSGLW
jgi:hypothetical protein